MRARRAFTLVELLVVIAIIGILIALLLPAVQAAREAARRSQCSNNLKQLGLALHNYHGTLNCFPPGFLALTHQGTVGGGWAWGVFLMPYIEQSPLQGTLSVTKYTLSQVVSDPALAPMLQMKLDVFTCPSSPMERLREFQGGGQMVSTANYTCNRGFFNVNGNAHLTTQNNGVLFGQSAVRISQITDGASNTIALGERTVLDAHASDPSKWPSWCGPGGLGVGSTVSSSIAEKMNHATNMHSFSSDHPGGASFCFCDGSVRFISENIKCNAGGVSPGTVDNAAFGSAVGAGNIGTYQLLGVRNDGQPVGAF